MDNVVAADGEGGFGTGISGHVESAPQGERGPSGRLSMISELSTFPNLSESALHFDSHRLGTSTATSHEDGISVTGSSGTARSSFKTVVKSHTQRLLQRASERSLNALFGSDLGAPMRAELSDLVTFQDSWTLLRGVHLSVILRSFGSILATSSGSAETFMLSKAVERLSCFISHNWPVNRSKKIIALCFHFHFNSAFAISVISACLIGVMTALKVLPAATWSHKACGFTCRTVLCPIFFSCVFFSRGILSVFGWKGPKVFLDKTCIHQVDAEIQRRGIQKLGAFIRKSDQMLVLYTDMYLQRLWTVYEVASCLAVHPLDRLKIVSIVKSNVICIALLWLYLYGILRMLLIGTIGTYGRLVMVCGVSTSFVFFMRVLCREWVKAQTTLSTFCVQNCRCSCEADRPLVYGNIALLMQAMGKVQQHSSLEEALRAFDLLVRRTLAPKFVDALGGSMLGYNDCAVLVLFAFGTLHIDDLRMVTPETVVSQTCTCIIEVFALGPCSLKLQMFCASRFLHLQRKSLSNIVWVLLSGCVCAFICEYLRDCLNGWMGGQRQLAMVALATVFSAVVTIIIFHLPLGKRETTQVVI
eukprot:TRINITY_DN33002_c0_g1_i3.p1 TRINITY_DN33002_c0_g1~~TRINITY_DN33002_c0_g1_i3.p1  ORF type:complete len:587 (-),score=46.00 TRINITY_DN33002_c0_g1_i3:164-1924(-)